MIMISDGYMRTLPLVTSLLLMWSILVASKWSSLHNPDHHPSKHWLKNGWTSRWVKGTKQQIGGSGHYYLKWLSMLVWMHKCYRTSSSPNSPMATHNWNVFKMIGLSRREACGTGWQLIQKHNVWYEYGYHCFDKYWRNFLICYRLVGFKSKWSSWSSSVKIPHSFPIDRTTSSLYRIDLRNSNISNFSLNFSSSFSTSSSLMIVLIPIFSAFYIKETSSKSSS